MKVLIKDNKSVKLPSLTAVKRSEVQKVKTDLMIFGRNEYLKAAVSYSAGLQKLSVVNCSLIRFDVRILALRHLVELNLSQNSLKELDFSLERLKSLRKLNLSSNQLTWLPSTICRTSSLISLDLSNNQLSCLPVAFGTMNSLVNVKLNNNRLGCLPSNIGQLSNLRSLNVSDNQLVILPFTIELNLNLDMLDISGNRYVVPPSRNIDHNYLCDTLQERAARVIKNSRIYYSQHVVGRNLCDFLDSAKQCSRCAQSCFGCIYNVLAADPKNMAREIRSSGGDYVLIEVYYCSSTCYVSGT